VAAEPEEKKTEAEVSTPTSDAPAGPPSGAALKGTGAATAAPATADDDGEGSAEDSPQQQENRRARRAAAAKARKMRMRERQEAEAVGLDTQEVLDDALVRSRAKVMKWLSRNSSTLQAVVVVGLLGWAAWGGYEVYAASARADASSVLAKGLTAEAGRIGEAETGPNEMGIVDPTPVYKDDAARLAAAHDAFAKATVVREGSGTALYAKLSLAAVQLDEGKPDDAKASFESVLNSPLASSDVELKARALAGLALALEAKADKEGALARYGELEKLGPSFADTALYERARLQRDLGRNDDAKATLKTLREKLGPQKPGEYAPSYLRQRVQGLSQELDPEAARAWSQPPALTPERLKQLEEQVKKSIGKQSDAPMPEMPMMPIPTGAASGSP
jgi:predicted negative regulator of RcsB-dependent stress response